MKQVSQQVREHENKTESGGRARVICGFSPRAPPPAPPPSPRHAFDYSTSNSGKEIEILKQCPTESYLNIFLRAQRDEIENTAE
ncbi:hypothetical protein EVAR_37165_1 [Eumeta japonica]|uniref:Uncharacterized protein n=1 Tax=Eumeta variegata TaxID=151549 RepID=A0A4C1WHY5_EUMVA|nr:hypothetical protein EVAR_37165_1 [Eumeta japonica]